MSKVSQEATAEESWDVQAVDSAFVRRVFLVFAGLALLSAAITVAGKWVGRTIAASGHTESTTVREIVIGNNVLAVPENMIRFPNARRDGVAERLDLYLRWPGLEGYSDAARDDFNHSGADKRIIFASLEERMMSRDMTGRLDPIYRHLTALRPAAGPADLQRYDFLPESGYTSEVLFVGERLTGEPFVARCLGGPAAAQSLAPCERDVHIGRELSLHFRFPAELLPEWRAVDAAVTAGVRDLLRTDDREY